MNVDITALQVFRGEVLKELDKFQGDYVKISVIKKSFSPTEGMPMSKFKSVINYLNDKNYIEWEKKDIINDNDDLIRITAHGQDILTSLKRDVGIII